MPPIAEFVVIEAIIDEHGNVTGTRAISEQPLPIPSALSAVSKRKYEPTILDGDPTPIDLQVEVTFSIGWMVLALQFVGMDPKAGEW